MNRWLMVTSALIGWMGLALLLSELRWFSRVPLAERLRPYAPGAAGRPSRSGFLSAESLRDVVAPIATSIGERVGRAVGVMEHLDRRLQRVHSPLDVTTFRMRQAGWAVVGLGSGALAALALRPPVALVGVFTLVPSMLGFLLPEQRLAAASADWRRRVALELPVVAEQLATLLGAGWSLGGAIGRLADRGSGACAADLARVRTRVQHGLSVDQALGEWADLVGVDALDRLIPVLSLHGEATDLGRLLGEEARNIRRELHRDLLATIERRSQQVWIPVTVATLVPGVIFLAVPFIEALRLYSGS